MSYYDYRDQYHFIPQRTSTNRKNLVSARMDAKLAWWHPIRFCECLRDGNWLHDYDATRETFCFGRARCISIFARPYLGPKINSDGEIVKNLNGLVKCSIICLKLIPFRTELRPTSEFPPGFCTCTLGWQSIYVKCMSEVHFVSLRRLRRLFWLFHCRFFIKSRSEGSRLALPLSPLLTVPAPALIRDLGCVNNARSWLHVHTTYMTRIKTPAFYHPGSSAAKTLPVPTTPSLPPSLRIT